MVRTAKPRAKLRMLVADLRRYALRTESFARRRDGPSFEVGETTSGSGNPERLCGCQKYVVEAKNWILRRRLHYEVQHRGIIKCVSPPVLAVRGSTNCRLREIPRLPGFSRCRGGQVKKKANHKEGSVGKQIFGVPSDPPGGPQ